MSDSTKIAVLITSHNRKNKTLSCLDSLFNAELPEEHRISVFLVDDASLDGTGEAVKQHFPEVMVLQGDGKLFWNRGMRFAWETAAKADAFDYFLWLNDDTNLYKDALINLFLNNSKLKNQRAILVGATQSSFDSNMTYSGEKDYLKLVPNGSLQLCDTFNGNFVLIPKLVYEEIGMLNPIFSHSLGDFDYGWKAKTAGINSYVISEFIGICEKNENIKLCFSSEVPLNKRIKHLYSPLGCNPFEFFIYDRNYFGIGTALKHFFSIHLKAIFPK